MRKDRRRTREPESVKYLRYQRNSTKDVSMSVRLTTRIIELRQEWLSKLRTEREIAGFGIGKLSRRAQT